MIRSPIILGVKTLTVRNLNAYDHLIINGPCIQSVRWKRKPIWLPTAKSKVFRVPKRPEIPVVEYEELKRLHHNYKTLMKSLKNFFIEKEQKKTECLEENVVKINVENDFKMCNYINDIWNNQVAAMRERRLAKEREDRVKEINIKLKEKAIRDLSIQERVDAEIRKAKEEAPTFITRDTIDEAIRNALENVVNHNVAIDSNGNIYDKPMEVASSTAKS
ncbi:putative 28S ribosomal protein S26, mitochondrial [Habropoda laboriosa]|uniref:Small ribosomal subunit protein mS26 n=1 Tax=Habropoda laboriosa TaxID=597456 RepID=A0A0L7QYF2_9HYME|nr:PREDICTED: probable 28S ribosomal protein S26, mitochondrial [Habropoda laboriosa]KOC63633.1 putative 28S ribosomal protein S26, mitochondrial [Habropoda laboriosa]